MTKIEMLEERAARIPFPPVRAHAQRKILELAEHECTDCEECGGAGWYYLDNGPSGRTVKCGCQW